MKGHNKSYLIFDKYAGGYHEKYADVSQYALLLDRLLFLLAREDVDILDVACGPANLSGYLYNRRPNWSYYGIDLSPKMLEIAQKVIPKGIFTLLDCREIMDVSKKFQAILLGFCLPYLTEDEADQLLKNCCALLQDQGLLYISVTEGAYTDSKELINKAGDTLMMYLYNEDKLSKMWTESGFQLVSQERLELVNDKGAYSELIYLLKKI